MMRIPRRSPWVVAVIEAVMRTSIFLITIALTGCGTSTFGAGGSSTGTIPKMPPGANLPRWENICATSNSGDPVEWLVHAGNEGWELVTAQGREYCFKRPKVATTPTTPTTPATP
jgi:hypothetical protein